MMRVLMLNLFAVAMTLFHLAPSFASVHSSMPTAFCELAMASSADDATEALAESFRGLLEFGGELFTDARLESLLRDDAPAASFFENVPNADQRSTALNQSLARLGDWVALDAEDRGVDLERLRVRLQQVIRESRAQVEQEQIAHEAAIEELRGSPSSLSRVEMERGDATSVLSFYQAVSVGGGGKMILVGGNRLLLLDLETQSITTLRSFEKNIQILRRISDDQVLVWFGPGDPIRILDLHTGRETLVDLSPGNFINFFPSPNGDWLLVEGENAGNTLTLIEVATGRVLGTLGRSVRFNMPFWSEDGDSFAFIGMDDLDTNATLNGYRRGVDASGRAVFDHVYSMVVGPSIIMNLSALGQDLSYALIHDHSGIKFYRLTPQGLQLVFERDLVRYHATTFLRGDSEVVHVADGVVQSFDSTGAQTFDPIVTNEKKGAFAAISPSQRYLLIQSGGLRFTVVDLRERRVMGRFRTSESVFLAEFSEDDSRLYLIAREGQPVFEYVLNLESLGMN